MKLFIVTLLLLQVVSFAQTQKYIVGMENSKYAFAGYQPFEHWGVAYKNSIFSQDVNLQYGQISLFYTFSTTLSLKGYYVFFGGMRYNSDYYDLGGELNLEYDLMSKFALLKGVLQPRYDSDIKTMLGYSFAIQVVPLEEIGIFAGLKNLPEYRNVERRAFAGLSFETRHLKVFPEISFPFSWDMERMRVMISFVYCNVIM